MLKFVTLRFNHVSQKSLDKHILAIFPEQILMLNICFAASSTLHNGILRQTITRSISMDNFHTTLGALVISQPGTIWVWKADKDPKVMPTFFNL